MSSFDDVDVKHVPAVLLGGPLDGARFKIPLVPPNGEVPAAVSVPLKQPASTSPFARYLRQGDELVGGYFVFIFDACFGPDGEKVLYAPIGAALTHASAE